MKTYASKREIYKDFQIALKFGLERPVHVRDYDNLIDMFPGECQSTLSQFARSVKNYNSEYPLSTGFFVEVKVRGDTGKDIGVQFVLLEHETGWEWFLPWLVSIGASVGKKIVSKVADEALNAAQRRILAFMKQEWSKRIRRGVRIDHIEIRTEQKGVMRIPFSWFEICQIECLMKEFSGIGHLSECNDLCFGGRLVEPPAASPAAD